LDRITQALAKVELAGWGSQIDPFEGQAARSLDQRPEMRQRQFGALAMERQIFSMERQFMIAANHPHGVRSGDFRKTLPARFFVPQHDSAVHNLTRPGIAHGIEIHLKSELAAELDLDVANMAWPINAPGMNTYVSCGQDREHQERRGRQTLAERSGQGKHPCLPEVYTN
jgi:hypothetical protein